jgi:hypothetical protein
MFLHGVIGRRGMTIHPNVAKAGGLQKTIVAMVQSEGLCGFLK